MSLIERVAQAISDRVNQPGQCSYQDMADVVIPVVIEECARVAERFTGSGEDMANIQIAAAIRALKDKP